MSPKSKNESSLWYSEILYLAYMNINTTGSDIVLWFHHKMLPWAEKNMQQKKVTLLILPLGCTGD